jgi:hypothetical protein
VVAEVRPFEADDNGFWVLIAKEFNSFARYPIRTVVVSRRAPAGVIWLLKPMSNRLCRSIGLNDGANVP